MTGIQKTKAAVLEHQRLSGAKTGRKCEVIMTKASLNYQAQEA